MMRTENQTRIKQEHKLFIFSFPKSIYSDPKSRNEDNV